MDWWTGVRAALETFLDTHGVLASFVFILIEEAGIPVPVPGDFLMLVAGVHARQGGPPLWQFLAAMEAATVIGASLLYACARRAGRTLVYRYGRFLGLSPARLDRAEGWLKRRGVVAVVLGRLLPGLRMATVIGCGVFEVPPRVFFPGMAVGAFLYILLYTLLGYLVGPPVLTVLEGLHIPLAFVGSLVLLLVLTRWLVRARRALPIDEVPADSSQAARFQAGARAGLVAILLSTLLANVLVHVAGRGAFLAPGTLLQEAAARLPAAVADRGGPLALLLVVPAFLLVGVLWGGAYGRFAAGRVRLPDVLVGALCALPPLLLSLLLVEPALGAGASGAATIGELIRYLAYGAALGTAYPLFLPRATAAADHWSSAASVGGAPVAG